MRAGRGRPPFMPHHLVCVEKFTLPYLLSVHGKAYPGTTYKRKRMQNKNTTHSLALQGTLCHVTSGRTRQIHRAWTASEPEPEPARFRDTHTGWQARLGNREPLKTVGAHRLDTGANWRVLALSQAHHRSRLSDSVKNGNALSSVHNAALPAR